MKKRTNLNGKKKDKIVATIFLIVSALIWISGALIGIFWQDYYGLIFYTFSYILLIVSWYLYSRKEK